MRTKALLAAGLLAVVIAPLGAARAEHCSTRIFLLSGRGLLFHTGAVGCDIGEEDANTDIINPGSNQILVRWTVAAEPLGPSTITFSGITGPTGPRGGCVAGACTLKWVRGTDTTGAPASFYDSQFINISNASSVNGGEAVVSVCQDAEKTDCDTRNFRTVA